mgnify:CR=1 FL=1
MVLMEQNWKHVLTNIPLSDENLLINGKKMFLKMEQAVALLNKEYIQSFTITKENRTKDLEKIFDYLQELCIENEVIFVHGRGKRKSIHQNTMNYSKK